ncbi:TPA: hypothetical protein NQG77_000235 [Salmonella enterica subsp. enterica serovar Infantis]|nr:hypothetical protein [Salmonella enterica subsp. enterica serovar Infantis]
MNTVKIHGREMRFLTTTAPKVERLNKILALMLKYKISQRRLASMSGIDYDVIRQALRKVSDASLERYEELYSILLEYHFQKVKEENKEFGWLVPANYKDHPDYKEPTV